MDLMEASFFYGDFTELRKEIEDLLSENDDGMSTQEEFLSLVLKTETLYNIYIGWGNTLEAYRISHLISLLI